MTDCKIYPCSCSHSYQDKKYGEGKRVWNPGPSKWRCSVCGKEMSRDGGGSSKVKVKQEKKQSKLKAKDLVTNFVQLPGLLFFSLLVRIKDKK